MALELSRYIISSRSTPPSLSVPSICFESFSFSIINNIFSSLLFSSLLSSFIPSHQWIDPDTLPDLQWLCTTDLIPSLMNKFDPLIAGGASVHENASQALVDIIAVSLNSSSGNSSPLIAQLESEEMIQTLYKYMLNQGLSSSLLYGVQVVIELLRRHPHSSYAQQGTDSPIHHDDLTKLEDLSPLFRITVANLDKMKELLSQKQDSDNNNNNVPVMKVALPYPIGEFEPLGFHRLKIIEFFAALIACNYSCIDQELARLDVLSRYDSFDSFLPFVPSFPPSFLPSISFALPFYF